MHRRRRLCVATTVLCRVTFLYNITTIHYIGMDPVTRLSGVECRSNHPPTPPPQFDVLFPQWKYPTTPLTEGTPVLLVVTYSFRGIPNEESRQEQGKLKCNAAVVLEL